MLSGGALLILGLFFCFLAKAVQQSYPQISLVFNVSAWIMLGVGFIFGILALVSHLKR